MSASKTITIVKNNGEKEVFDSKKLVKSLMRAGADEEMAIEIANKVERHLENGDKTRTIYKKAHEQLAVKREAVAARYSLRQAVADLGPTGFPFENFIAGLLEAKGYKTTTGEVVMGECVAHEVDVVAYNDQELIMAEAKFHSQSYFKSDLKVVLYVNERFRDLSVNTYNYGKKRKLDKCWLITNTKFTTPAIQYAECRGLTLIGWNYPKGHNLQDMIEESFLHPITAIPNLSGFEKDALLSNGIVLCRHIFDNPEGVEKTGIQKERAEKIINTTRELHSHLIDKKQ